MEPYIETPRLNVFPTIFSLPWYSSTKYLTYRLVIFAIFIIHIVLLLLRFAWPDEEDLHSWAVYIFHLLKFTVLNLNTMMCAQTLFTSVVGFDKIYLGQLCFWALSCFIATVRTWMKAYVYSSFHKECMVLKSIQATFLTLSFLAYIIFNIKTRLLYIYQYREAIERSKAHYTELFTRLLIPILCLLFTQIILFVIKIFGVRFFKHDRCLRAGFGATAVHLLMRSALVFYELYMYLALSTRRHSVKYLISKQTTKHERILLLILLVNIILAIMFTIWEFMGLKTYDKIAPILSNPYALVVVLNVTVWQLLIKIIRYVVMWYYALKVWNVNDLSWNSFENELMGELSSTFEGVEIETVVKRSKNKKRVTFDL